MTLGDEEFKLKGVTVQEMAKVKSWTSYKNRGEWFAAIGEEDPDALIAAYVLCKQRKGEQVRFSDVDFDLDALKGQWVDETGREVEPVLEKNKDGSFKTDKNGLPVPVLDKSGRAQWRYVDTGDAVPPVESA